jgi:hypothetical protein
MSQQKRFRFRIMSGVHSEGSDADLKVYGPSYLDDGEKVQTQKDGDEIETDCDLAASHNTPGGVRPRFLLIKDRGEQQEEGPQELNLDNMNLRDLRRYAKQQDPPIDLTEASNADEARNMIRLCLETA